MSNKPFCSVASLIFLICIAASVVHGQNQTIIGLGGGISKATGDGSEFWKMGFNINGELFQRVSENVLIGGRLTYNRWNPDEEALENEVRNEFPGFSDLIFDISGSLSIIEVIPTLRLVSSVDREQQVQLFVQMGAGYYNLRSAGQVTVSYMGKSVTQSMDASESDFGFDFGAGIIVGGAGHTRVSVYPMYSIVLTEGESTKYFVINLGITFGG